MISFKKGAELMFTCSTKLSWPQVYDYKHNWDVDHYWAAISS